MGNLTQLSMLKPYIDNPNNGSKLKFLIQDLLKVTTFNENSQEFSSITFLIRFRLPSF